MRRTGELLKEIETAQGQRTDLELGAGTDTKLTRTQAAAEAGLSKRQKETALRVASIPPAEFEAAVESDKPPTVTELAERPGLSRRARLRRRRLSLPPLILAAITDSVPRYRQRTAHVL